MDESGAVANGWGQKGEVEVPINPEGKPSLKGFIWVKAPGDIYDDSAADESVLEAAFAGLGWCWTTLCGSWLIEISLEFWGTPDNWEAKK